MILPGNIRIGDFDYFLPPERIAQYPLANRDESKLLVFQKGMIREDLFLHLDRYIPGNSILIFNNTRVIRARLIFSKETGATIEIFCLDPIVPSELELSFHQTGQVTWKCLVGNVKRWKSGILQKTFYRQGSGITLFADKKEDLGEGCFAVSFSWTPVDLSFSAILNLAGLVPLPPYISRASEDIDRERYQTIYAHADGSVAAPTAGLHFTKTVMDHLIARKLSFGFVTLHVGLATFRPVSSPDIANHVMHSEKIIIPLQLVRDLIKKGGKAVLAVGTTSVRTLESIYWLGVKILIDGAGEHLRVHQWDPYEKKYSANIEIQEALQAVADYLEKRGMDEYSGSTELLIVPGYRFRIPDGLITNFHMPQSTLLLLVAAFTGPGWKTAYEYALKHDFRFLSYGDACLFFPYKGD